MADATTLRRMAETLRLTAENTPHDDAFWPALAQAAASALESPPTVTQAALPAEPFLALLQQQGGGYAFIAKAATLAGLQTPSETYLQGRPPGTATIAACEIKKVFQVG